MGTVHDILEARGKEAALAAIDRAVVEAASTYLSDETGGIGFLYSGWCQAALPHRRLADDEDWTITRPNLTLAVEPGRKPGADGKLVPVGVPYGSRARLIMLYLQSEALRTGTRDVLLGRSLRDWLGRMNISIGGKSLVDVREQADRIARCRFTFHVTAGTHVGLVNQNVMDTAMFVPSEDPAQNALFVEVARLSEVFFDQLRRHPVPVEEAAIRAISNNSMALDLYAWLAYRLHALEKSTPVSWVAVKGQFGTGFTRMNNFKPTFLANLKLALAVYRDAKVQVEERGLVLYPSRPPVAPRIVAVR
ncbi:replication protein RepA [Paracraurococcus lichenis]|uniref:Replication protein RepA n=1 Tax=Paracraurococcus lichenis TaxID=3064888 RepID=A0ABT9E827_9PROT|nr:replication protein RepA [Paracraurococcus sp. LOR1-02]MDO9712361.1 replication protein RepA [Paracraurococcus sp. LOR1-02]